MMMGFGKDGVTRINFVMTRKSRGEIMNKIKRAWRFVCDFIFYARERFSFKEAFRLASITRSKK